MSTPRSEHGGVVGSARPNNIALLRGAQPAGSADRGLHMGREAGTRVQSQAPPPLQAPPNTAAAVLDPLLVCTWGSCSHASPDVADFLAHYRARHAPELDACLDLPAAVRELIEPLPPELELELGLGGEPQLQALLDAMENDGPEWMPTPVSPGWDEEAAPGPAAEAGLKLELELELGAERKDVAWWGQALGSPGQDQEELGNEVEAFDALWLPLLRAEVGSDDVDDVVDADMDDVDMDDVDMEQERPEAEKCDQPDPVLSPAPLTTALSSDAQPSPISQLQSSKNPSSPPLSPLRPRLPGPSPPSALCSVPPPALPSSRAAPVSPPTHTRPGGYACRWITGPSGPTPMCTLAFPSALLLLEHTLEEHALDAATASYRCRWARCGRFNRAIHGLDLVRLHVWEAHLEREYGTGAAEKAGYKQEEESVSTASESLLLG